MKVSDAMPIYNVVKIQEFNHGDAIMLEVHDKHFFIEYSLLKNALIIKEFKQGADPRDCDIIAEFDV